MKKFKKLFGLVLSLVLALALSTTAFAASLEVKKRLTIDGGTNVPEETFTFQIIPAARTATEPTEVNGFPLRDGIAPNPAGDITGSISYSGDDLIPGTGKVEKSVAMTLTNVTFPNEAAYYKYTVKEVIPNPGNNGMTYDEAEKVVYVAVDQYGTVQGWVAPDDTGAKTPVEFDNTFTSTSLTVTKTVVGNSTEEFEFAISVVVPAPCHPNVIVAEKFGSDGTLSPDVISSRINGQTFEMTIRLKHGESVVLSNLISGSQYTVTETNAAGFTTSIDGVDVNTVNNTIGTNPVTVGVVNTQNTITPTGLIVNYAPYIFATVLALAAIALMVLKKKRVTE